MVGQVKDHESRLKQRLSRVEHVVAIMSGKGGVGKSSVTVNLASALARLGLRTGILDADINGASAVQMTGVDRQPLRSDEGIHPAVTVDGVEVMSIDLFLETGTPVEWNAMADHSAFTWRGMVEVAAVREMLADTAWSPLDILLVDLPPGTDKLPNLLDLVPRLSAAVVVTVPSRASTYVVRKSILLAQRHLKGTPMGLVENMSEFVCDDCGHVHRLFPESASHDLRTEFEITDLGRIPFDPSLAELTDDGESFLGHRPDHPAAQSIMDIAGSLCYLVGIHQPVTETTAETAEDTP